MTDESPNEHNQVVRSISVGTLLRVLRYPFVIAAVALIPRLMGDTVYGQYAYYLSIFLILDIFGDIGFIQIFGRFIPEHVENKDGQKLKSLAQQSLIFGWCVSGTTISILVLLKIIGILPHVPNVWILILGLQLILTQTEGILFSFLYGLNRMVVFSAKEVVRSACTLGLVYILYLQFGLTGALVGLVLNEGVLTLIAILSARDYIFTRWQPLSWSTFKPYILFGLQFYVPAFLYGMLQRTGNVYVKHLTESSEQVGYFDVANQFLLLIASFMALLISTLLPSLTTFHLRNEFQSILTWQRNVLTYCVAVAMLIINALIWMGEPVIVLALGEEFKPVWPNAVIISFAFVPVLISHIGMNYTIIHKDPKVYTLAVLAGFATMTGVSFWLIQTMGAAGAAWGTLAGYGVLASIFILKYRKEFLSILAHFPALGIAALTMFAFRGLPVEGSTPLALFAASSLVFLAMLILFRVVKINDLRDLNSLLK